MPPPIWRYDPQQSPLISPGPPAPPPTVPPQPGFFASQSEEPGPYNRLRPYYRKAGALIAAAVGGPPIGLFARSKTQVITALIAPYTAQNGTWPETDVCWYDVNGGWMLGYMPDYGGGLVSSWYELDGNGNVVGQNNDNLGTTRPDGIIHLATVKGGVFVGTEENPFNTPTEQAPVGTFFRRGLQIVVPKTSQDSNGFDWTVTDYIYPGDPGFRVVRIDQHNPSSTTLDGLNAFEQAQVAGLNNNASEWPSANTGYGSLGGSFTSPVPTASTSGEPDFMYATPGGSAGKILGVVGMKRTAIADSTYSAVNFQLNANATPRTKLYYQATVGTVAPGTKTTRVTTAFRRNLTGAESVSINADIQTPDTAGTLTNVALGSFTAFRDDEGAYEFASTGGSSIQFQHSISGNVTKRWLCVYKVTGWTATTEGIVKIGATTLVKNVDYLAYVDTSAHILYLKLMKGIVPSGAGATELNNGIILIQSGTAQSFFVTLAVATSAAISLLKQVGKSLSVNTATTPSLVKQVNKSLSVNTATTPSLVKQVNKALTVATATVSSLTASKLKVMVLSVATAAVPSLFKQVGKVLSANTATSPSLVKQVGKVLSVNTTASPSLVKQVGKVLSVATATVSSLIATKVKLVLLSVATAAVPSLTKQVSKLLSVNTAAGPTLTKQISKTLTVNTTASPSLTSQKVRLVVLAVVTAIAPSMARQITKSLSISTATVPTMPKQISKVLSVNTTASPTLTRRIGKALSVATSAFVSVIASALGHSAGPVPGPTSVSGSNPNSVSGGGPNSIT